MCYQFARWFCEQMTFLESSFAFPEEKLELISIQKHFYVLAEAFTSNFTWNQENLNYPSSVKCGRMEFSECPFVFKIAANTFTGFRITYLGSLRSTVRNKFNNQDSYKTTFTFFSENCLNFSVFFLFCMKTVHGFRCIVE